MTFLNLKYGLIVYEDQQKEHNPEVRTADISREIQGVAVNLDRSEKVIVNNNEIKDIATTSRAALWDASTELEFDRFKAGHPNLRLKHTGTGTAPSFRSNRNIGGAADTQVTMTRLTDYVVRIQNTAGTAWNLTAVQVNDFIKIEATNDDFTSPFSETNQGKEYLVQAKGVDYIDFVDNGSASLDTPTLGADFATVLKVLSQGPVRIGDTVEIAGAGVNPSNTGKFEVMNISDDYIEFINPLGVEETVTLGTNTFVVYEYLIGFIHLTASAPIKVRFSEQTEWVQLDRLGAQVIFFGSVCTHKIQALNDGPNPVTMSIQSAMVPNVG